MKMEPSITSPSPHHPGEPHNEAAVASGPPAEGGETAEALVLRRLSAQLGGLRGSLETALPVAVLGLGSAIVGHGMPAIVAAVAVVVLEALTRLTTGSTLRFVGHGAVGLAVAVFVASLTGRAEDAFLPGLVQTGLWALALGISLLLRRPAGGYLVGAVLGDPTGWLKQPAIVRLGDRLTLVLLAPMIVRVAIQLPLYLAGATGWLGVSRVVLGWPLHVATLAAAGSLLLRGRTPLGDISADPARDDDPRGRT